MALCNFYNSYNTRSAQEKGEKFDFIFGDLTDTPVMTSPPSSSSPSSSSDWQLVERAARLAARLLSREGGRYMTHCNGRSATAALRRFEAMAAALETGDEGLEIRVRRRDSFVPSFMETWVFYELRLLRKKS